MLHKINFNNYNLKLKNFKKIFSIKNNYMLKKFTNKKII